MEIITLRELITHVRSGNPFSMKYVTLDLHRKKGGEIREVAEACGMQAPSDERIQEALKRPTTPDEEANINLVKDASAPGNVDPHGRSDNQGGRARQPQHRQNFTLNYQILQEGNPTSIIRKFHPSLCIEFNGKTVAP